MRLAEQFRAIEASLPAGWADARLRLRVEEGRDDRAAALLGPLGVGRTGDELRVTFSRSGAVAPTVVARLLDRLDGEGIRGRIELVSSEQQEAVPETPRDALAAAWDRELEGLPSDWSDLYVEIDLDSSDHLPRGALLLAPVNPARHGGPSGFRFRCARTQGYGASSGMVRRCLERLDGEGISGAVRILRALSDTSLVATQGPVWYVEGKAV